MKPENIIGKRVDITNRKSIHYDNWGFVTSFDGRWYHVSGGGIGKTDLVFEKKEFKVRKNCTEDKCKIVNHDCQKCDNNR